MTTLALLIAAFVDKKLLKGTERGQRGSYVSQNKAKKPSVSYYIS